MDKNDNKMVVMSMYNSLLARYKKAEVFMENAEIPINTKLEHVKTVCQITQQLSKLLDTIEVYTDEEGLNGFRLAENEERRAV